MCIYIYIYIYMRVYTHVRANIFYTDINVFPCFSL